MKNGVPSQKPEKGVTHMIAGDEFRTDYKCIDVDSKLLRLVSRVSTRHVYWHRQWAVNSVFQHLSHFGAW